MFGAGLQSTKRSEMFARLVAHLRQTISAERRHPLGKPRDEWRQFRIGDFELRQQPLRALVTRVGADRRIHIGTENVVRFGNRVERRNHRIGCSTVAGIRRARLDAADLVFVKEGGESTDVGAEALHCIGE